MWDPMYNQELQFKWSFGLFAGVFLKENKKPAINQPAKFLIEGC